MSSPRVGKALEELKEGDKKLSHRNKLILIADSSEEGWEAVNKYQHRALADDNDDDKLIRQAGVRASQKRQCAQLAKKSSSPSSKALHSAGSLAALRRFWLRHSSLSFLSCHFSTRV